MFCKLVLHNRSVDVNGHGPEGSVAVQFGNPPWAAELTSLASHRVVAYTPQQFGKNVQETVLRLGD